MDFIQIGTRNMQDFDLLKELGRVDVPVVLKRGMSATISGWLMAAEYIAAGGNHRINFVRAGHLAYGRHGECVTPGIALPTGDPKTIGGMRA